MKRLIAVLATALVLPLAALGQGKEASPTEQDPLTAKREVHLAATLRCLVCQNQSIAESNAELAVDLRRQIREQIAAGKTDQEIIDFMVGRYGDFVLYRPPLKTTTVLLWAGPALLLVAGVLILLRNLRERRRAPATRPLTREERERAEQLLGARGERR
jgi:cytochrome c-type biogenesis protein CcmH